MLSTTIALARGSKGGTRAAPCVDVLLKIRTAAENPAVEPLEARLRETEAQGATRLVPICNMAMGRKTSWKNKGCLVVQARAPRERTGVRLPRRDGVLRIRRWSTSLSLLLMCRLVVLPLPIDRDLILRLMKCFANSKPRREWSTDARLDNLPVAFLRGPAAVMVLARRGDPRIEGFAQRISRFFYVVSQL